MANGLGHALAQIARLVTIAEFQRLPGACRPRTSAVGHLRPPGAWAAWEARSSRIESQPGRRSDPWGGCAGAARGDAAPAPCCSSPRSVANAANNRYFLARHDLQPLDLKRWRPGIITEADIFDRNGSSQTFWAQATACRCAFYRVLQKRIESLQ